MFRSRPVSEPDPEQRRKPLGLQGIPVGLNRARGQNRTDDLLFTRQLLCQLSYSGDASTEAPQKAVRSVNDVDAADGRLGPGRSGSARGWSEPSSANTSCRWRRSALCSTTDTTSHLPKPRSTGSTDERSTPTPLDPLVRGARPRRVDRPSAERCPAGHRIGHRSNDRIVGMWDLVVETLSSYLAHLWAAGGLLGPTAADAGHLGVAGAAESNEHALLREPGNRIGTLDP